MPNVVELGALVERYALALSKLNLADDEQEEYSTMLLWLQNQVETASRARESCSSVWSISRGSSRVRRKQVCFPEPDRHAQVRAPGRGFKDRTHPWVSPWAILVPPLRET
jgi:hypothetical protein